MKTEILKIYNGLLKLCNEKPDCFGYVNYTTKNGNILRNFFYRYVSYSDWLLDYALFSRGTSFYIDKNGEMIDIACRTMPKFFNYGENPFTQNIDFLKDPVKLIMCKEDGSLVSSYIDSNQIKLKTKKSINNIQCLSSTKLLNSEDENYKNLKKYILENKDYTFNFEYVSRENKIVLNYNEERLILLNVINKYTGEFVDYNELKNNKILSKFLVSSIDLNKDKNFLLNNVKDKTNIEGFVVMLKSGLMYKLKTDWYINLSRVKENLFSNRKVFELIINKKIDDIKADILDDKYLLDKIKIFENIYFSFIKEKLKQINDWVRENEHLNDKGFAVKTKEMCNKKDINSDFSYYMLKYKKYDTDKIINMINNNFLKNYDLYTPKEYLKKNNKFK